MRNNAEPEMITTTANTCPGSRKSPWNSRIGGNTTFTNAMKNAMERIHDHVHADRSMNNTVGMKMPKQIRGVVTNGIPDSLKKDRIPNAIFETMNAQQTSLVKIGTVTSSRTTPPPAGTGSSSSR